HPLWLTLPATAEPGLELVVALPVAVSRHFSVSRIWIGPRDELEMRWLWRTRVQVGLPQAVSLLLAVLFVFALSLWARRPGEGLYGLFAVAAAAWLVRNL
ncbi:hypothetical protein C6A79_26375, partial [Escherichia coli]|uniref:hypothetical protein n=1 Tax=Escherichia coli TaxID=562 RepID=UPI000DFC1658